jgi:ABC-2 type transport system permease protein
MIRLRYELRLLLRSKISAVALLVLLTLSVVAVITGLSASARQNAVIDRVAAAQQRDLAAVAKQYGKPDGEAGYAAYYTFHLTSDRPSSLAFAAMGQRDIQPYVLRVRLLGLQAQLYETEAVNAELALPGPFDFAFVLIYLAPLVVIALMHDLVSGEREAGRLRVLSALPARPGLLWLQRAGLRLGLVLAALLAPLLLGALAARADVGGVAALSLVAVLYVAFWAGLGLLVGAWGRRSAFNAAALVGCWVVLVLLVPALGNAALSRAVPVGRGVDLTLAQREAVHHAWDIPREAVMEPFLAKHPEWKAAPPTGGGFHWSWYYAMHEMGDDSVAGQVAAYRASLAARQAWTERLGWLSPAAAAQSLVHRIADSDLPAHLAYQDSVAAFHRRLQTFYYPYLFGERPFLRADFDRAPAYAPRLPSGSMAVVPLLALMVLTAGVWIGATANSRRTADQG